MPESVVSHVVEKLNELSEHAVRTRSRAEEGLEIIEAVVLALVAVATAWSGYQAARWDSYVRMTTCSPRRHRLASSFCKSLV